MKIKWLSIITGLINGGVFSITPFLLYNYLLTKNVDNLNVTDIALQGVIYTILFVFLLNIVLFTLIYRFRIRESLQINVFLYIFISWVIATLGLVFIFFRGSLFKEGDYGENIEAAFGLLCIIINFITVVVSAIIAKLMVKLKNKNIKQ